MLISASRSVASDSATPWTVARQAPLFVEFSRQKCWSGVPFPSPGDLPDPGIKPRSLALQADSLPSEPPGSSHARKVGRYFSCDTGGKYHDIRTQGMNG